MSAVVSNDDAVYGKRTSCVWADEVTKFEDAHDCIVVERDLSIDPVVRVGSARLIDVPSAGANVRFVSLKAGDSGPGRKDLDECCSSTSS